jgi:hypothetical protein
VVDIHSYRKLKPTKKDELIQGIRAFCHAWNVHSLHQSNSERRRTDSANGGGPAGR